MKTIYFENKIDQWNNFVSENAIDGGLLQSWQWGELAQKEGKKIWRLGLKKEDELLAIVLVIKEELVFKTNVLYLPRGPVIKKEIFARGDFRKVFEILNYFLEELKKIAKREKVMVIRFDLPFFYQENYESFLVSLKLRRSYKDIQPKITLILDITKSEDELLAQMKPKTRYNVRLAEKKDLKIKNSSLLASEEKENFNQFYKLLWETSRRDSFGIHPRGHYQNLLASGLVKLFLAYKENQPIAGIMVGFFGKTAVYIHGASSFEKRSLMAPYLLHWQAIKFAKEKGFLNYDFGGIKSEKFLSPNQKNWAGLTRFKTGFAPNIAPTEFLGLWEYPLKPVTYFGYKMLGGLVRKVRKLFYFL